MSNLITILNIHFPEDISKYIIEYLMNRDNITLKIEKQVYYINSCNSWNIWWKKNKILTKKERVDYSIKTLENELKKDLDFFHFILY